MRSHGVIKASPNKQLIKRVYVVPVEKTKVTVVKKSPLGQAKYDSPERRKEGIPNESMKQQRKTQIFYRKIIEPVNFNGKDGQKKATEKSNQNITYSNVRRIDLKNENSLEKIGKNQQNKEILSEKNHPKKKQNGPDIQIAISLHLDEQNNLVTNQKRIIKKQNVNNQSYQNQQRIILKQKQLIEKQKVSNTFEINAKFQQEKLRTSVPITLDEETIILKQNKKRKNQSANNRLSINLKPKKLYQHIPQSDQRHSKQPILLNQYQRSQQVNLSQKANIEQMNSPVNILKEQFIYVERENFNKKKNQIQMNDGGLSRKGSMLIEIEAITYPRCLPQLYCKHPQQ